MAAADAVVVASTGEEAFGRAAVEAQAAGRPVIVSGHGALLETVIAPPDAPAHLRTGWRVPPGDAQALANAIAEALTMSPADRKALGARARSNARRFSLPQMTQATLQVYAQLLGRPV
jgi:glycosyltransferase involved in cell wall biosynthesis